MTPRLPDPFAPAVPIPRSLPARWTQFTLGMLAAAVATALMVRAGIGLGPWDAFHLGLHRLTTLSVGMAAGVTSLAIVLGGLAFGVRPRFGTFVNPVLFGLFVDLVLPVTPAPAGAARLAIAAVYLLAGIALTGAATGMYIAAGLGAGPRDGLMVAIAARTGWPVQRVRMAIELFALAGGWLMGGTIGIGTVVYALGIGPAAQRGLRRFGALPAPAPLSRPADVAERAAA